MKNPFEGWGGASASEKRLTELTAREQELNRRLNLLEKDMAGPNGTSDDATLHENLLKSLREVQNDIADEMHNKQKAA